MFVEAGRSKLAVVGGKMQELHRLAAQFRLLGAEEEDLLLHELALRRLVPSVGKRRSRISVLASALQNLRR